MPLFKESYKLVLVVRGARYVDKNYKRRLMILLQPLQKANRYTYKFFVGSSWIWDNGGTPYHVYFLSLSPGSNIFFIFFYMKNAEPILC